MGKCKEILNDTELKSAYSVEMCQLQKQMNQLKKKKETVIIHDMDEAKKLKIHRKTKTDILQLMMI